MNESLIILDRDGVINEDSDDYIKTVDEFVPLPESLEAIARLNHAGYMVMVATNQSGLARGYFDIEALNAMHAKLKRLLSAFGGRIDAIFFCPHGPDEDCDCRKPKPGLLLDIAHRTRQSLKDVYCVGDSFRDIQAAREVQACPVLVRTGKGERTLEKHPDDLKAVPVFDNLARFVDDLLKGAT